MLNPIHLRSLRMVLECGSISRAAHRLGYSPSALSQQMSALERATGVQLFERAAHSLRPTEAGIRLGERSAPVLLELEALARELTTGQRRKTFRIGSSSALNCSVMPTVLRRCRTELPELELMIHDGEPSALIGWMVGSAALDLALLYQYEPLLYTWPRGFLVDRVAIDPIDVVLPAGHLAAARTSLPLASLAGEAWITHTAGVSGALSFERACAHAGFVPRVTGRSDEFSVIMSLVAAGHGIAAVPRTAALPVDGVVRRGLTDPTMSRSILALRRDVSDKESLDRLLGIFTVVLYELLGSVPA
jgi:DNA-binding transcriptional LysR family regulator